VGVGKTRVSSTKNQRVEKSSSPFSKALFLKLVFSIQKIEKKVLLRNYFPYNFWIDKIDLKIKYYLFRKKNITQKCLSVKKAVLGV
jgi:hypothetical protein